MFMTEGTTPEDGTSFLIAISVVSVLFLILSTLLSKKRVARMKEHIHRWKDIKDLEEDYDVYVTDEYAYHIADNKMQMRAIKETDYSGIMP